MSHVPHELSEEFPDKVDVMHALRESDAHFARLTDEYHTLNRTIHRVETDIEPMSDAESVRLRKERMVLKDQIARMLSGAPAA